MKSRCTYCGSADYGKGCSFGPHKTHFHANDGKKCAYCGSGNFGKGCKLNPTSDLHIHGINYNTMFKESMQEFVDEKVLMKELKRPFKEFACFKAGIIDGNGNKLKEPVTESEKSCYGPHTKAIIRIKKYLGSKIELLEAENSLCESSIAIPNIVDYKKTLDYQDKIHNAINELYKIIEEAQQDGLPFETIKTLIKA
jgi:hypothetical protein